MYQATVVSRGFSAFPVAKLRAAAEGEAWAVGGFVDHFWPRAHRIAVLVTAGAPDAEDIAQDTILRALAALRSIDLERPIEPWLDRVAGNAARDWLRKRARRCEVPLESPDGGEEGDGWPGGLDPQRLSDGIMRALRELTDEERTVVVLRHLLDMRATEVARMLDLPEGSVRSLDHRALKKLRRQLEPEEATHAR